MALAITGIGDSACVSQGRLFSAIPAPAMRRDRGAGGAGPTIGRPIPSCAACAHTTADRRPGGCAAAARLHHRRPGPLAISAAGRQQPAGGTLHRRARSGCAAMCRASSSPRCCWPLPLASADRDVVIAVQGELISKPYVEITLNLLARFGIEVRRQGFERFTLPAAAATAARARCMWRRCLVGVVLRQALGALAATSEPVRIEGRRAGFDPGRHPLHRRGPRHGRRGGTMGYRGAPRRRPLRPVRLDCNHIPDAAMTLAVMALYASGTHALDNIASWRVKETDRIAAMAAELRKLGATVRRGTGLHRGHAAPEPGPPRRSTPRRPPHRHVPVAGGVQSGAVAGAHPRSQSAWPRPFRTTSRRCSRWCGGPMPCPVITIDGPTASGKGTRPPAWQPAWAGT